MTDLGVIFLCIGFFCCGCVAGGIFIYVFNLKRYHEADISVILDAIERTDYNMGLVHENMKKAVKRFGVYADVTERHLADIDGRTTRVDMNVAKNLNGIGDGMARIGEDSEAVLEKLDDVKKQSDAVSLNTERILERLKLMV